MYRYLPVGAAQADFDDACVCTYIAGGCDTGRSTLQCCLMEAVCQDTLWPTCMVRMSKRPRNSFSEITIPKMVLYISAEVPEYLQKAQVVVGC